MQTQTKLNQYQTSHTHSTNITTSKFQPEQDSKPIHEFTTNSNFSDKSKPAISTFKLKSKHKKKKVKCCLNPKVNTNKHTINWTMKAKLSKSLKQPQIMKISTTKLNGKFYQTCQLITRKNNKTRKFVIGIDVNVSIYEETQNIKD